VAVCDCAWRVRGFRYSGERQTTRYESYVCGLCAFLGVAEEEEKILKEKKKKIREKGREKKINLHMETFTIFYIFS
jgi:hypothetical protein